MTYNLKNMDEMGALNKKLHLGKLHKWVTSTVDSNLITSLLAIERDWGNMTGYTDPVGWTNTLTYHYNAYEEELIKRGHYE